MEKCLEVKENFRKLELERELSQDQKSASFDNHGQHILKKKEKSSKIGEEGKSMASIPSCYLISIAKVSFLEGRLSTRLCFQPNLRFF